MNTSKTALVTGGSSGIGRYVALMLAEKGYQVAVVASHSLSKAQNVVDDIQKASGKAKAYTANVGDLHSVNDLISAVIEDFQRLDVLINAAGIFLPTPAGDMPEDIVHQMIDVNLHGVINTINAVVPHMQKSGGGKIVNFSSVAGLTGTPSFSVYSATKAAVIMFTKSLAIELAPHNINVNAIAPGNTKTPMNEDLRTKEEYKPVLKSMSDLTPSNQTFSNARDIAAGVLFLVSDEASPMYGSVLVMDEGVSAGMKL